MTCRCMELTGCRSSCNQPHIWVAAGAEQPVDVAVDSYILNYPDRWRARNAAAEVLDPDGERALTLEEATTRQNAYQLTREGFFEVKTRRTAKIT